LVTQGQDTYKFVVVRGTLGREVYFHGNLREAEHGFQEIFGPIWGSLEGARRYDLREEAKAMANSIDGAWVQRVKA
jgi:hypothetical protein